MNQASHTIRPLPAAIGSAAAILFTPSPCWPAGQPALPWDDTLEIMQNFVSGPFARFVIVVSSIVTVLAFALADDRELAWRFAKAVVGTGVAFLAVQLLNYLAP